MPTADRAQKQTSISQFFKPKKSCATEKTPETASYPQPTYQECHWQPDLSNNSGDMSFDFAHSSNHSYYEQGSSRFFHNPDYELLTGCRVPASHVINQVRDDRDLEHELESSKRSYGEHLSIPMKINTNIIRVHSYLNYFNHAYKNE